MIRLIFDRSKLPNNFVRSLPSFFNEVYEEIWFTDERVKQVLREVECADYLGEGIFNSSKFGKFVAEQLSGGTKLLIMALMHAQEDYVFKLSVLGDNCFSLLEKYQKDIELTLWADCQPLYRVVGPPYYAIESGKTLNNLIEFGEEYVTWFQ